MKSYLPFVVAGLTNGSIYGLAAVGLVLTYKTSGVFNLAFAAQAFFSAAVYYDVRVRHGWPLVPAFIATRTSTRASSSAMVERSAPDGPPTCSTRIRSPRGTNGTGRASCPSRPCAEPPATWWASTTSPRSAGPRSYRPRPSVAWSGCRDDTVNGDLTLPHSNDAVF